MGRSNTISRVIQLRVLVFPFDLGLACGVRAEMLALAQQHTFIEYPRKTSSVIQINITFLSSLPNEMLNAGSWGMFAS